MSNRLGEIVCAVTGGGSGIGEAICQRFAVEGARVAVIDIDLAAAQNVVEGICQQGGQAHAFACDVADAENVQKTFASVKATFGSLGALVNNAGVAHIGGLEKTTESDLDRVYAVNVKGVFNCLRACVELLKNNQGGSIINMGSIACTVGIPDRFAYSMSKGALLAMTRSVACDYVRENIRCNCISPARVHTPFVDNFLAQNYPGKEAQMRQKLSATQPVGRMGTPKEIASLAVYLASDESTFVTGANYEIDGGFNNLKP
jgi:NAD(P)-dependent dehydrogenase (short-subunit alcohol dehydrogenase family)